MRIRIVSFVPAGRLSVQRLASVRFASALAQDERDATLRSLASVDATVGSWATACDRTYALVACADPVALADALGEADVREPPVLPLRITAGRLVAVEDALVGSGGPNGVVLVGHEAAALIVELRPERTSLALVVALVDAACGGGARRIEPLLPLCDATIATFAAAVLGDPALGADRIIEPHLARAMRPR